MVGSTRLRYLFTAHVALAVLPSVALAQNTGIAGVVRDTSGAVLPGVTVEASSPVLIEKVRTVTTDAQGLYSIVDLRPGQYEITFSLAGFQTVKRAGVELTGSFTANVNTELAVGAVQETITVSGQTPTVDIRNVVSQTVLNDELRQGLPAARNVHNMAQLLPGTAMSSGTGRPSSQDVGGLSGDRGVVILHGGRAQDYDLQIDGHTLTYMQGVSQGQAFNPAEGQEYVYQQAALPAEYSAGGFIANVIPKEGGNRFTGFFLGTYTNGDFQSNNLDDNLRNQGLRSTNELLKIYDYNAAVGGPLRNDRLWFFSSFRSWGQEETIAGVFRPIDPLSFTYNPSLGAAGNADLSRPNIYEHWNKHFSTRLTWQASPRNKLALYVSTQPRVQLGMALGAAGPTGGPRVFEAAIRQELPLGGNRMIQATWKTPITSKLLFQAVYGDLRNRIVYNPTVPGLEQVISASDAGTGFTFRSAPGNAGYPRCYCYTQPKINTSLAYVTGSHASKFGVQYEWGGDNVNDYVVSQATSYTLRNAAPISLTTYLSPRNIKDRYRDLGLYAQDQWTIKRLTVNAGVRFDYHHESIPEQTSGPGRFAPAITWAATDDLVSWKDLSPRLGVGFDLFGNGKTALKASLNRYVVVDGVRFAQANNPLGIGTVATTATRGWTDANLNYVPDCNLSNPAANGECAISSNSRFGTDARILRPDDAIRQGFGARVYNWEGSVGVQHELLPRVGLNVAYFRRSYGNFTVTDNLAVTPGDYSPYCVTVPTDSRLPGSGGQLCGLYDLNPNRAGLIDNLTTFSKNFGTQKETYNGVDVTTNVRAGRLNIAGGISSGTSNNIDSINSRSNCFVVDSPQQQLFCDIEMPWRTSARFLGTTNLPWDIDLGVTLQNNPGPQITAAYTITNAQAVGLGRNLTAGTATVPLIQPGTLFGDRLSQVDIRLGKNFKHRGMRIRALLDIANVFNANTALVINNTFGSAWQRPTVVLPGRLIKPNVQIDF